MKPPQPGTQPFFPSHRFIDPFRAFADLVAGLTLLRSYFHAALRQAGMTLHGTVIDLGGKQADSEYHRILLGPDATLVCTDLHPAPGVVAVDVEKPLPFESESADAVLAFHLLEHVFDLSLIAPEVLRVLRPGGTLVVSTPFQHRYHGDLTSTATCDDYWRFSHTCLKRWFEEAGFECRSMQALGEGMFCSSLVRSAYQLTPPWLGIRRLASAAAYIFGTLIDRLASLRPEFGRRVNPVVFAEGYLAVFVKPAK